MIDFDIVGQNILAILIIGGLGYIIYQNMKGNNVFGKFKGNLDKLLVKTRLR